MWYVYDLDTRTTMSDGIDHMLVAITLKDMAMKRIEASGGFYASHMLVVRWVP